MVVGATVAFLALSLLLVPIELMVLFALFPWLYVAGFIPVLPLGLGITLVLLGVNVRRCSRQALIASVVLLGLEAIPSTLVAGLSAGFAPPLLPRGLLLIYLASTLKAVSPHDQGAVDQRRDGGWDTFKSQAPAAKIRVILAWVVAVVAGLALGLASRAGYSFLLTTIGDGSDRMSGVLDWWFRLNWPSGLLAFAVGWFAASDRAAIARSAVALVVVAAVLVSEYPEVSPFFGMVGSAMFGASVGWLGHQSRGRSLWSVLAALCLPALMAIEVASRPRAGDPLSTGAWVVLASAATLAAAFIVRAVVQSLLSGRARRKMSTIG